MVASNLLVWIKKGKPTIVNQSGLYQLGNQTCISSNWFGFEMFCMATYAVGLGDK